MRRSVATKLVRNDPDTGRHPMLFCIRHASGLIEATHEDRAGSGWPRFCHPHLANAREAELQADGPTTVFTLVLREGGLRVWAHAWQPAHGYFVVRQAQDGEA